MFMLMHTSIFVLLFFLFVVYGQTGNELAQIYPAGIKFTWWISGLF